MPLWPRGGAANRRSSLCHFLFAPAGGSTRVRWDRRILLVANRPTVTSRSRCGASATAICVSICALICAEVDRTGSAPFCDSHMTNFGHGKPRSPEPLATPVEIHAAVRHSRRHPRHFGIGLARHHDPGCRHLLRRLPVGHRLRAGGVRVQPACVGRRTGAAVHQRRGRADPGGAVLPEPAAIDPAAGDLDRQSASSSGASRRRCRRSATRPCPAAAGRSSSA